MIKGLSAVGLLSLLAAIWALAQAPVPQKTAAAGQIAHIDFVKIAPGEFLMGCSENDNACEADEKPARMVQIEKPFEIGKYEVTQAQWQSVMGANPSVNKGDSRPVEMVSKDDAHEFISRLNARNDGFKYRLPSEAEWEYAARAGSSQPVKLDEVAWYGENSNDETHPVGTKKPNIWGLYDMLGNVREWVEDGYAGGRGGRGGGGRGNFKGGGFKGGGPKGGDGKGKGGPMRQLPILRGGAWDNPASFVRLSARYHYYGSTLKLGDTGFRLVREAL